MPVPGLCYSCQRAPLAIDGIRSVLLYEGEVRQAIRLLKYRNRRALVTSLVALMVEYWQADPLPVDVVVAVPLHPARQRERGYNQARLLACGLGDSVGLPVITAGLRRVRHTRPQVSLNAPDRRKNVEGAFACQVSKDEGDGSIRGRRVLVVDDVCTTGSTLEACSLALKTAGAASVWGFTLARAG